MSSSDLSHWPTPKGYVYTREATAYALLALVKAEVSMSHLGFLPQCHTIENIQPHQCYLTQRNLEKKVSEMTDDNVSQSCRSSIVGFGNWQITI